MKTNFIYPDVFISVGKNRKKIYNSNTVYLENKQEFEFELSNMTKDNVMAKISINGKPISNRGLVLRPGIHGFIERYIDENRKFLFETYLVNGNSTAVQKAIENNGDIKIEFFKEKQKPSYNNCYLTSTHSTGTVNGNCSTYTVKNSDTLSFNDADACLYSSTLDYNCAPEENVRGIASAESSNDSDRKLFSRRMSKDVETGRVEKGSVSGQHFTEVDMEFEYYAFHTVTYKLMPLSQKPAEFSDLKLKCESCNSKLKYGWKMCPHCGAPIKKKCMCKSCGINLEAGWTFCPNCGTSVK